jgi:P pilus assembly chaperone PapD
MMFAEKLLFLSLTVILTASSMSGCQQAKPTPAPVVVDTPATDASCSVNPVTNQPVLYGLWVMDEQSS